MRSASPSFAMPAAQSVSGPQAVYVGDHAVRDVKAARAAGLHAIDVAGSATLAGLPGRVDALEEDA